MADDGKKAATAGIKRQFAYSAASVIGSPFLYISLASSDVVRWATEQNELPVDVILYIALAEIFKVFCVIRLVPANSLLSPSSEPIGVGCSLLDGSDPFEPDKSNLRLPFSKKDSRPGSVRKVLLEIIWGFCTFAASLLICHVILVLFGAPFIEDWLLTLELSFLLVCWMLFPLCLMLHPASILPELFYISTWNCQHHAVAVTKYRFIASCIGAWVGAIVVPLDWDRPWQKWPIPCLYSAAASHVLMNVIFFLYLLFKLYGYQARKNLFHNPLHKVKSF